MDKKLICKKLRLIYIGDFCFAERWKYRLTFEALALKGITSQL